MRNDKIELKSTGQVGSRFFILKFGSHLNNTHNYLGKFRPKLRDRHFWIIQIILIVIAVSHSIIEAGGYLHHLDVLYFLPVSLFFIPVIYAALYFGSAGSIVTVIWAVIITIPNWVFWHEGLERIGVIFQMCILVAMAILAGRRVDQESMAKRHAEESGYLLKTYADHIINAQEGERKRIAQELHDETIQTLSIVSQRLAGIESMNPDLLPVTTREIMEIQETIEAEINGLRQFIRSMRPPILDDLGIIPAIRRLLIESTERTGMKGAFNLLGEEERFSQEIEAGIFRIVQEAIWNVERHSNATELTITITLTRDEIRLDVNDNGIGFNTSPSVSSLYSIGKLGILGMYERAELMGGKFQIQSVPNEGTTINLSIPLSENPNEISDGLQ